MEEKNYIALGLMSGTSMDGVDASIITSIDGEFYDVKLDKYFEYSQDLSLKIVDLRNKIKVFKDLNRYSDELKSIEKEITIFHAKAVNDILQIVKKKKLPNPKIIGFHGQTIFHSPENKTSVQLGDGRLLSQLTKKRVIYNFRQNDLNNDGQGAPLTPIFHKSLKEKILKKNDEAMIINIGGISNATFLKNDVMFAADIGPGNCLIDEWIRINSNNKFDKEGSIARSGKINELIFNQALDNFQISDKNSLDIKDFDVSFVRGLSLEDGASTLTNFTAEIVCEGLKNFLQSNRYIFDDTFLNLIICGGGRKNKYLMELLEKKISKFINFKSFKSIDDYDVDGDFIESQAFAFLAVRSNLKLPISFPETTGCKKACTGGVMVKNF